jgi:DNA-binding CsgD family transcriptional regulator
MAYANAGSACGEYYRFELADRYLAPGIAYTTERDYDHGRLYMMSWQALSHLHQGRWNAAADMALAVLDAPGRTSISHMATLVALGRLRARRGDPGAMEALDEALELAQPTGSLQRIAPVRAARAEAAWLAGDAATTISEARAVYPLALAKSHPWFIGELAYWQWKAGALDAPPELAAAPFRLQMQRASAQAAAAWEARNCPYEAARALAEAEDESSLKRALRGFDHLGALPAADRVRQQLRELGLRSIPRGPRSSTRTNAFQLTSRELEIIALLAQGLTNAEIAARLYRSAKTVDHHVSSVLSKLSVSTREAAVAAATAQGLLPK